MKTWRIPMRLLERCGAWRNERGKLQYGDERAMTIPDLARGEIVVWSRNTMRWYRFRNARKDPAHYAYLAQRGWIPVNLNLVITEVSEEIEQ